MAAPASFTLSALAAQLPEIANAKGRDTLRSAKPHRGAVLGLSAIAYRWSNGEGACFRKSLTKENFMKSFATTCVLLGALLSSECAHRRGLRHR